MSSKSKSRVPRPVSRLRYLRKIAERIDAQLKSEYGSELCADVLGRFCSECSKRLDRPVPGNVTSPNRMAVLLMRKAAGTELRIEFNDYARQLLGDCRCTPAAKGPLRSFTICMPDGSKLHQTADDVFFNALWAHVSADMKFMQRFKDVHAPHSGRVSLCAFRERFLELCCVRKVSTGAKALPLLDELTEWSESTWMN